MFMFETFVFNVSLDVFLGASKFEDEVDLCIRQLFAFKAHERLLTIFS